MDDLMLDPRLPALVEIEEPNRQQARRITRTPTRCAKCLRQLSADDLCFADGRDAHRSCAEMWNQFLFDTWAELKDQDAAAEDAAWEASTPTPSETTSQKP